MVYPRGAEAFKIIAMDAAARTARIGARIRMAREARGLSQNALARLIPADPVSGSYVSRWERGENRPSPEHLELVASALDVTVAWLNADDDEDEPAARAA